MKVSKTIRICKRNQVAKDKADLKYRGYTDRQYAPTISMSKDVSKYYHDAYIKAEDDEILRMVCELANPPQK